MNTVFALVAEYGTTEIPLEVVAEKWLALSPTLAKRAALRNNLPFPCYRGPSQKSPWFVKAHDLAAWIDEQYSQARDTWERINGPVRLRA